MWSSGSNTNIVQALVKNTATLVKESSVGRGRHWGSSSTRDLTTFTIGFLVASARITVMSGHDARRDDVVERLVPLCVITHDGMRIAFVF